MPSADIFDRTEFKTVNVYIFDDKHPETDDGNDSSSSTDDDFDPHKKKCEWVRKLFTDKTPYEVTSVGSAVAGTKKAFKQFWKTELASKGPGDLIVIYYDGAAGGNGEDYTW